MRLTLVISSLGAGGAERVLSLLANHWASRGWSITILTLGKSADSFYTLAPSITITPLNIAGDSLGIAPKIANNIKRIRTLRRAIKGLSPQAVISFMDVTNILVMAAAAGLGIPVTAADHCSPRHHSPGAVWNALKPFAYRRASKVVLLSESVKQWYPAGVAANSVVIPNPVMPPLDEEGSAPQLPKPLVMAMGRFTSQKGFDLLLKAFAQASSAHPEWSLVILGDGPDKNKVKDIAAWLGIAGKVSMPGNVKNPYAHLKQADIFVLSSRYEGFPMSLCEAMACGVACVSFDCDSGPADIIRNGVDGILVPDGDVNGLADAMRNLMGDKSLRERIAVRAPEVTERFGLERVSAMWDGLLNQLVSK